MISDLIIRRRCKLAKGFLPSFTPEIYSLSVYTSHVGTYSNVSIAGKNFLPNGITYVNFGNFTNIPVTYTSSFTISFVVPTNAPIGSYNVVVVIFNEFLFRNMVSDIITIPRKMFTCKIASNSDIIIPSILKSPIMKSKSGICWRNIEFIRSIWYSLLSVLGFTIMNLLTFSI